MQIGVAYSENAQQVWMTIELPEAATVADAIAASGILARFPQIDLDVQKTGIFGKIVKPDSSLRTGDRVEIYRPITCDPQTVARRDGVGEDD